MTEIIHKELSYEIMEIIFEVYNELGYGLREKTYQNAISNSLKEKKIKFTEQQKADLKFKNQTISRFYLDFLIEDKIIVEIKTGEYFNKENIAQVYGYLKSKSMKLGIIVNFTKRGVRYKRIIYKDK